MLERSGWHDSCVSPSDWRKRTYNGLLVNYVSNDYIGGRMALKIYGNYLGPETPANLRLDVQGLEKLYVTSLDSHAERPRWGPVFPAPSPFSGAARLS